MGIRDWGDEDRRDRGGGRERSGQGPGEARYGRGRDEDRFGPNRGERRYGTGREARPGGGRERLGREDSGRGGRGEARGYSARNVDEEPYPRHPLSHRYRGYEEEPAPFTGPRGPGEGSGRRRSMLDTWEAGGGTPGYTGWGIERFGSEEGGGRFRGYPMGHMGEDDAGGVAFPHRFGSPRFEDEFPSERTAPRRGRGPRNYRRSDERIREDVNERLMQAWMNSEDVEVRVESGEVTLTGFVDTREEKRAIEDVAADVLGVLDVHNMLRVDPERRLRDQAQGRTTDEQAARH